ncbi:MAG: Transcriptional regulatory protein ZraR [Candidatus Anoxychlamydiales bacterium]|nr:Transcriptional regulatory protein ZraR [Candidatus Anoxychlamydiales bacterium]
MIKNALIVDDEKLIRYFLTDVLKRLNIKVKEAQNATIAIEKLKNENFDLIITDIKMPNKSGLDVLKYAKKKDPFAIVIIITAFGSIDTAINSLNLGAFNYLLKPFSIESIETIIKKANEYKRILLENTFLRNEISNPKDFDLISKSNNMQKILKDIDKIAMSNASVFITGESGTGKEMIAKAIHYKSLRRNNPFVKINLASIPESLLESELFGHEKGSFTGAIDTKKGRFEIADTGTILLDEITEMPIHLQAKLLRAIQEKEIERVGSTKSKKINVRFIATSNRDINKALKENKLRIDLFYRLNVLPINIPSLKERKDDILILSNYFLDKFCNENNKSKKTFTKQALDMLLNYSYPGNVRELANIIERAVVLSDEFIIDSNHILLKSIESENETDTFIGKKLSDVERLIILKTIQIENNNKTKTAKKLGISIKTLRSKLKDYHNN